VASPIPVPLLMMLGGPFALYYRALRKCIRISPDLRTRVRPHVTRPADWVGRGCLSFTERRRKLGTLELCLVSVEARDRRDSL